jgi:hypothetical protein
MRMLPTLEVRWFIKSKAPDEVVAWFQQGELKSETQNPRVDYYFELEEIESLSIKLREGRVEVKQRLTDHGTIQFHELVSGRVEGWHKWSFSLADNETTLNEVISPSSKWIAVRKERILRKYAVINKTGVEPVPVDLPVNQGCQVELSNITVAGIAWWSVCFEAIGKVPGVRDVLLLVIKTMLAGDGSPTLQAKDSFSYPYWLNHYAVR